MGGRSSPWVVRKQAEQAKKTKSASSAPLWPAFASASRSLMTSLSDGARLTSQMDPFLPWLLLVSVLPQQQQSKLCQPSFRASHPSEPAVPQSQSSLSPTWYRCWCVSFEVIYFAAWLSPVWLVCANSLLLFLPGGVSQHSSV